LKTKNNRTNTQYWRIIFSILFLVYNVTAKKVNQITIWWNWSTEFTFVSRKHWLVSKIWSSFENFHVWTIFTFEKMSGGLEKISRPGPKGWFQDSPVHPPSPLMTSHSGIPWCSQYEGNMTIYEEIWRNMWKIWRNMSKIWMKKPSGLYGRSLDPFAYTKVPSSLFWRLTSSLFPWSTLSLIPWSILSLFPSSTLSLFPWSTLSLIPWSILSLFPSSTLSLVPWSTLSLIPWSILSLFPLSILSLFPWST